MRQWGMNNLLKVVAQQRHDQGSNPRHLDRKSNALPRAPPRHPLLVAGIFLDPPRGGYTPDFQSTPLQFKKKKYPPLGV